MHAGPDPLGDLAETPHHGLLVGVDDVEPGAEPGREQEQEREAKPAAGASGKRPPAAHRTASGAGVPGGGSDASASGRAARSPAARSSVPGEGAPGSIPGSPATPWPPCRIVKISASAGRNSVVFSSSTVS